MFSRFTLLVLLALLLGLAPACRTATPVSVHAGLPVFAEGTWDSTAVLLADDDDEDDDEDSEGEANDDEDRKGLVHRLVFYIPNRVFDVFDIVRARLRFGPGFAVGARATDIADVNVGFYTSFWIGLHGPRLKPSIPWPVGIESFAGAEVSVIEADVEPGGGPGYGPFEFGAGVQVALLGIDIGVEPLEVLDLIVGLVTIDLVGDDY
jgi:hypothetical protein